MPNSPEMLKYLRLVGEVGKAGLNSLFPNDFEYYMVSLELVDSRETTFEFFSFPIMPDSIEEKKGYIQNIRKTFGGVTVLSTDTFTVNDISLKGNFGKKLKFLLGDTLVNANAFSFKKEIQQPAEFSRQMKTGFGCIKVLERICDLSKQVDSLGNPFKLYFYNPAIGNSYMVEVVNFSIPQAKDTNMIWNYNLTLRTVAPLVGMIDNYDLKKSLTQTLKNSVVSKGIAALKSTIVSELFNMQNVKRPKYLQNIGR